MLRLDIRAAKLAGLISREEDYPARLFGITFKHNSRRLLKPSAVPSRIGRVATPLPLPASLQPASPHTTREPESLSPTARPDRNCWRTIYCGSHKSKSADECDAI